MTVTEIKRVYGCSKEPHSSEKLAIVQRKETHYHLNIGITAQIFTQCPLGDVQQLQSSNTHTPAALRTHFMCKSESDESDYLTQTAAPLHSCREQQQIKTENRMSAQITHRMKKYKSHVWFRESQIVWCWRSILITFSIIWCKSLNVTVHKQTEKCKQTAFSSIFNILFLSLQRLSAALSDACFVSFSSHNYTFSTVRSSFGPQQPDAREKKISTVVSIDQSVYSSQPQLDWVLWNFCLTGNWQSA